MLSQTFPDLFIKNETIYMKHIEEKSMKIDYKETTLNASKFYTNNNDIDSSFNTNNLELNNKTESNNLKRSHSQENFSNHIDENPQIKRFKSMDSMIIKLKTDNIKESLLFKSNDFYLKKVYDSLSYESSSSDNNSEFDFRAINDVSLDNLNNDLKSYDNDNNNLNHDLKSYDNDNNNLNNNLNGYDNDNNNYTNLEGKGNNNQALNFINSDDCGNFIDFLDSDILNDDQFKNYINFDQKTTNSSTHSERSQKNTDSMTDLNECYKIALSITEKVKLLKSIYDKIKIPYDYIISWCFYQIGIIFMIKYVNEGMEKDLKMVKFYENLLDIAEKIYSSVSPYITQYREMRHEAEIAVKNGTKELVIKDTF